MRSPKKPSAARPSRFDCVLGGDDRRLHCRARACPEHPAEERRGCVRRGVDPPVGRRPLRSPNLAARDRQLGQLFDRPDERRHLRSAERLLGDPQSRHRLGDARRSPVQLQANGQVYLVNPNGIAITPTGAVQVGGGFVASTLGIADSDFNKRQSQLCRQRRLGGRRQRRLDSGRCPAALSACSAERSRIRASSRSRSERSRWARASRRR